MNDLKKQAIKNNEEKATAINKYYYSIFNLKFKKMKEDEYIKELKKLTKVEDKK